MTQFRLPIVNSDDGVWGDELLQWLKKQHTDNGTDDSVNNGNHQFVTIIAGTTSAAPLTLASGSLKTAPAAGSIEFLTDRLYFTQTTSTVRKVLAAFDDSSGATGDVYYRDSSGNFVRLGIGSTNYVLTVVSGLPSWQPATGGGATKKIFTIGDGSSTSYTLTHSLGTADVITQLRFSSDNSVAEADIVNTSTSVTTVTFANAPATNSINAVVIG